MSDLRLNTIAGCGLGALLLVMGLREASSFVFHPHVDKEPAFAVTIATETKAGPAAEEDKPIDWGRIFGDTAQLASFVERGDKAHKQCLTCHADNPEGTGSKTGPNLYGLFGRTAGAASGYASYSASMKAYAQPWSYDNLYAFLKSPGQYIKGTSMTYAGVRRSDDRIALVAYLRNLSGGTAALPAPLLEAAPASAEVAPAPATEGAAAAPAPAPAAAEPKAG
jgi:cytochrome c